MSRRRNKGLRSYYDRQLAALARPINAPRSATEPPNSQLQSEDAWRAVWAAELSSRK